GSNGPEVGRPDGCFRATPLSTDGSVDKNHYAILSVEEPLGLRAKELERLEVSLQKAAHGIVPAKDARIETTLGKDPLDLLIEKLEGALHVAVVPSLVDLSDDLQVLRRHRRQYGPRQPGRRLGDRLRVWTLPPPSA